MEEEIWKTIFGWDGYYLVSNMGNVKSIDRYVIRPNGVKVFVRGVNIKKSINKHGYLFVNLTKGNKCKSTLVHRLVASAFIPNPENKPYVNHKNFNRTDNNPSNLEWCTPKENTQHALTYGRCTKPMLGVFNENHPSSKTVYQYFKNGDFISSFTSCSEAARAVSGSRNKISDAALRCSNKKSYRGYRWSYEKLDNLFFNK